MCAHVLVHVRACARVRLQRENEPKGKAGGKAGSLGCMYVYTNQVGPPSYQVCLNEAGQELSVCAFLICYQIGLAPHIPIQIVETGTVDHAPCIQAHS